MQRCADSVCLLFCFPSSLPLPLQRAFKGGGSQEGRSAQWLLCGRSCLYSCQADGEELTLPTAAPPPSLLAAGLAHTLTRSAPLERGQAVQLPAGSCHHSPGAVSEPETSLPGSRVSDPNKSTSLRSCGGRLAVVEQSPLPHPPNFSFQRGLEAMWCPGCQLLFTGKTQRTGGCMSPGHPPSLENRPKQLRD